MSNNKTSEAKHDDAIRALVELFSNLKLKSLDAIAALRAEAGVPAPLSDAPPKRRKAAKDTAERRQVTVMFSDLVGSTSLSARMDPEDLREVISAYQTCVADTVRRFSGFVAKYMGDGVLIYFGYPQAQFPRKEGKTSD
jgi:class 3 adenylate cyclase